MYTYIRGPCTRRCNLVRAGECLLINEQHTFRPSNYATRPDVNYLRDTLLRSSTNGARLHYFSYLSRRLAYAGNGNMSPRRDIRYYYYFRYIFAVVNWNPLSSNVSYVYATRGRARRASSKLSDIFPPATRAPLIQH